jgi:hypothetical protein
MHLTLLAGEEEPLLVFTADADTAAEKAAIDALVTQAFQGTGFLQKFWRAGREESNAVAVKKTWHLSQVPLVELMILLEKQSND